VSAEDDRILIQRLAAEELDAVEEQEARARIEREPALAGLLEELKDLQSRVRAAFPEPPAIGGSRAFAERLQRLMPTPQAVESRGWAEAVLSIDSAPADALLRTRLARARGPERGFVRGKPALLQRLIDVQAHLFHLREIRREDGLAVELEFYVGDILAVHSDVLLVSAIAGSYDPTPGSVFGDIADRYGISFANGPPPDTTRLAGGLLHFPGISCAAFDSLWVIEMSEPGEAFSVADLRRALQSIRTQLPEILANASSITLPLLGTGQQRLDPREVARELLSALPGWARHPRLRTVRIFTLAPSHVAALNRALDDRDFSTANSALYSARIELRSRIDRRAWSEPMRAALKDLLQIASLPEPSPGSIALEGRRVAEVALGLLERVEPAGSGLPDARRRRTASPRDELAAPHLQLLLAHGRAASMGEPVTSNDAVMIVYAAMRVAEMTLD
jgi:hypothetical protein